MQPKLLLYVQLLNYFTKNTIKIICFNVPLKLKTIRRFNKKKFLKDASKN